jgi:hypothetical protein
MPAEALVKPESKNGSAGLPLTCLGAELSAKVRKGQTNTVSRFSEAYRTYGTYMTYTTYK